MKISINMFPIPGSTKLRARARVCLLDEQTGMQFQLEGFRVIDDGTKPPWVGVPQEYYWKNEEKRWKDLILMNPDARRRVTLAIIDEYQKMKSSI